MSRRVKLDTKEKGIISVLLVNNWGEWLILKDTLFGDLFSVVSSEVIWHALHRYTTPLVHVLGIPPEGALRKVPRECWFRKKRETSIACPLYIKENCCTLSAKMPWCFEPDGEFSESVRKKGAQAIALWHQGVYIVVEVTG